MQTRRWTWLPNAITLGRCGLALGVGGCILALSPHDQTRSLGTVFHSESLASPLVYWIFGLFILTAATDFLDGFLARRLNAVSAFGAFWDPIADKILVAATLLALSYICGWPVVLTLPALLIICRDVGITLARLRPGTQLPVSRLAKYKTAFELLSLGLLLGVLVITQLAGTMAHPGPVIGQVPGVFADALPSLFWIGLGTLWFAAILAVWTGLSYLRSLRR